MKTAILKLCKLYQGEPNNPYKPGDLSGDRWAEEYLKFQIWDAELSVSEDPVGWAGTPEPGANIEDLAEEAYKNCVLCKLRKMSVNRDYNWMQMYFNL